MRQALLPTAATMLLGPPGRQRLRASQSLLALVVYMILATIHHGQTLLGLIDRDASNALNLVFMCIALGFYFVIRTGLNQRFLTDPSLTLPQTAVGVLATVSAYAVTGPARGAVISLLVLILVFGMFALTTRQSRRLALFAVILLSAAMLWKSRTAPQQYPPSVEIIHLVYAVLVLWSVSALSVRMATLRNRLREQKHELERALQQILAFATRDDLTGLANRRHMAELMGVERARQQAGQPMSVVLIDIDLFKRINDTHGHNAGDAVLRKFAQAGRQILCSSDVLARWGGEEFLMMLPATAPAQALLCIERLREALTETSFDSIAPGLQITFSAGLSVCAADDTLEATIERADQAMYRAKIQGRNRTVSDESERPVNGSATGGP